MNRRGFLKFAGVSSVALAAAPLLPEIWTPNRTIFLPPFGGWYPTDVRMREVTQYLINNDPEMLRYDMAWMKGGEFFQHYVCSTYTNEPHSRAIAREVARGLFRDIIKKNGYENAKRVVLPIPKTVYEGAYV